MLKSLRVKNLAVVEQAEIEFAEGLNVITGETGAGKSVLMGAIDLVLGGRADASSVRDGAKEAEVEATFSDKVVRRTITAEGRSRAWVNEETVSAGELKSLAVELVDVHGPTANQRLMEEGFQRETLDGFGKVELKNYRERYAAYSKVKAEIDAYKLNDDEDAAEIADRIDLLKFQVNELKAAELSEDDETLAERHAAAAHAEEIVANADAITEGLGGDGSAADILMRLQPKFNAIAKHFPKAQEWATKAEELTIEIQELSRTIVDEVSKMGASEDDLKELDDRLTVVNKLKRKFLKGVGSNGKSEIARLLDVLEEKEIKLDSLEHREERLAELRGQLTTIEKDLRVIGTTITKSRKSAAEKLAKLVTKELKDLGFLQAKFFVNIEPSEIEAHGCDKVIYMFEPNPGETARPLASIASSGEIARVMLALKVVLREGSAGTLVFDEIDANIGGEVGKIVGEKLRKVADGRQVIAITHLPQSAVFGERHLLVSKSVSGGRTRTHVRIIKGEDRVAEIARMLGGENLTSVIHKHAEELLRLA